MAEIIIGLLTMLASVAAIWGAQSFPKGFASEVPGAAFFPNMIAIALIIASLGLIYKGIKGRQRFFAIKQDQRGYVTMGLTILLTVLYVVLFGKLHFVLITTAYIGGLALLFGISWKKALPSAILSSLAVYLVFAQLLNVLLNG